MRFLRCAAILVSFFVVLFSTPASAQSGAYDLRWTALCGPNRAWTGTDPDAASMHAGQLRVTVTQLTGADGTEYWEMRDAGTGAVVIPFANPGLGAQEFVLPLPEPPCTGGSYIGSFEWNPAGNADGFRTFMINGESFTAGTSERVHVIGLRAAAATPVSRSVTFANLAAGRTIRGRYGVRMTAVGLGAGPYRWTMSVDGVQVAARTDAATTITFVWNTLATSNGTHTFRVRVLDAAGAEAPGSVSVIVRN